MKIIFPDTFDKDHPELYILNLYFDLGRNCFAFSVYNPATDGSYFYKEISTDSQSDIYGSFSRFFFDNEFLSYTFRKIFIVFCTNEYSYIPEILYKDSEKQQLMDFNFTSGKNESVLSVKIRDPQTYVIFKVPKDLFQFLKRSFPQMQIVHQTSGLIAYFQTRGKIVNSNKMIVNLREKEMDVLCFSYDKFILGNTFQYTSAEDSEYFSLFVWSQLKFKSDRDFLYISGFHKAKTDLMEGLKPYIKNILPSNLTSDNHFWGIDTSSIPYELSILSLCEL